jgi:predicted nuclease with TOPRIM domain
MWPTILKLITIELQNPESELTKSILTAMKGASQDQSEAQPELETTLSEATNAIKLSIEQNRQLAELVNDAKDTIKSYKNYESQWVDKLSQISTQMTKLKSQLETLEEKIRQKIP